jgi:cation transporter-like permease
MGCNRSFQASHATAFHWHQPWRHGSRGDFFMSLISLIITLIVVGVLLWLVNNYIPMDGKIKRILNIVVVVAVVVWLLNILGLMDSLRSIRIGR